MPLDLELPDVGPTLDQRRPGVLAGTFSFGPGPARFGSAPPLSLRTQMELALEGAHVTVESGALTGDRTDLTYRGRVRFPAGRGAARARGRGGPRHPGPSRAGPRPRPRGPRPVRRTVRRSTAAAARGRAPGRQTGSFDGVRRAALRGRRGLGREGLRCAGWRPRCSAGPAFEIEVPPPRRAARVRRGRSSGGRRGLAATLRHRQGRARGGGDGRGLRALAPGPAPALSGRRPWTSRPARTGARLRRPPRVARPGRRAVRRERSCRRRPPQAHLQGPITDRPRPTSRWRRRARTSPPRTRSSCASAPRPGHAGRSPSASRARASSRAAGAARWSSRLRGPLHRARTSPTWASAGARGVGGRLRRARGAAAFARPAPSGRRALGGRARARRADLGGDDAIDARVRIANWPAPDLVTALGWDVEVQGLVSGEATLTGRRSARRAPCTSPARAGRYYGVPYEDLDLRAGRGRRAEVTAGRARIGGGAVDFAGTVTDDGIYDGRAHAEAWTWARSLPTASALRWAGRVSGSVLLQGTLARPRVEGDLSAAPVPGRRGWARWRRGFTGRRRPRGAGRALPLAARGPALKGSLGVAPPYEADLRSWRATTSLDPFVRVVLAACPAASASWPPARLRVADRSPPRARSRRRRSPTCELLAARVPGEEPRGRCTLRCADGALECGDLQPVRRRHRPRGGGQAPRSWATARSRPHRARRGRPARALPRSARSCAGRAARGRGGGLRHARRAASWRARSTWRAAACACAASPTASRTCGAGCASTSERRISRT